MNQSGISSLILKTGVYLFGYKIYKKGDRNRPVTPLLDLESTPQPEFLIFIKENITLYTKMMSF